MRRPNIAVPPAKIVQWRPGFCGNYTAPRLPIIWVGMSEDFWWLYRQGHLCWFRYGGPMGGLSPWWEPNLCYTNTDHRPTYWDELRGNTLDGSITYLMTLEMHIMVSQWHSLQYPYRAWSLYQWIRQQKIIRGFEQTWDLLDPAHWPHPWEIPCRQMLWLWIPTLACFQTMGDYWLLAVTRST